MTNEEIARELVAVLSETGGQRDGMYHDILHVLEAKNSHYEDEIKKLRTALEDIGNILGGPTMHYSSEYNQLAEREKMAMKAHDKVREALK